MDTKYREGLPTILQNMVLVLSEDERPKKRRSRKKKLGKNGLYPGEDEFIKKCWKSRQLTERGGGQQAELSKDEEIKRHVSELRLRETQLQILLILEAIFLKNTNQDGNAKDENASGTKREKSTKKGEDLNVLLELLLDRLCIWHAVSAAESVVAESIGDTADNHLSGKKIESDALRDFCNEVIIPFYASRLPEQCKAIKKKLGGAVERSPSHPTPESKSSSKTQTGANDKRTQALKPQRRTLQRVLTDEQAAAASQRSRHPSLRRSSTTPALQEAQAESMEPSLPSLGGSVRGGIQAPRRVDKREVDLNAVAKQHETKIKKMGMLMEQKKELDAAISALRKPNRELVAKELAEQAEKRTTTTGSARKSKNPVRNPYGQGVQVMATPKASRKRDVNNATLLPPPRGLSSSRRSGVKDLGTSPALGSDVSLVPQSSAVRSTISRSVARREVNAIDETPSRGTSKLSDPLGDMAIETPNTTQYSRTLFKVPTLPPAPTTAATTAATTQPVYDQDHDISTPVPKRKSMIYNNDDLRIPDAAIHETPPRSAMIPFSSPVGAPLVDDTPVKRGVARREMIVQRTPEKSIYEQLGWDDDDLAL